MSMIFKYYRPRIAGMMLAATPDDKRKDLQKWLYVATFGKSSNGYWLAWHDDEQNTVLVLPPKDSPDKECHWAESWDNNDTIETAFNYIESGKYAEDEPMVLNLFIEDPETGECR